MVVYLDQLLGAHHTCISYHDKKNWEGFKRKKLDLVFTFVSTNDVIYGLDCFKKYVFFLKLCLNINIWHLLVKVGFEHCTAADFILDQCFPDFHKLKNI